MSNPTPTQNARAAAPAVGPAVPVATGPTWSQVVDMFRELKLPVCDDEKAIQESFERKQKKYCLDAAGADQSVAGQARANMKNAQSLIDSRSRKRLSAVVFDALALDGRALLGVLPQGSTVSASLRTSLLEKAEKVYHCRDDLAQAWVDQLIGSGGLVLEPPLLLNFRATNGIRQIRLEWDKPAAACDHVNVYRGKTLLTSTSAGWAVDNAVPSGPADYTARAACAGHEGQPSSTRGLALDEAKNPAARIENQQVLVSWDPPFAGARVCVFRRENARPDMRQGAGGPEPAGPDTAAVTQGQSPWKEAVAKEGVVLHYLIVVHDGQGLHTPGVHLQVRIAKPPEPPGPVQAQYAWTGGKDDVRVSWGASPTPGCQYVVVRRQGPVAPSSLRDGKSSATLSGTAWTDDLPDALQSGKRYTYAVFAVSAGIPSRLPSVATPVAILSEVASLTAESSETGVRLRWQPPAGVAEVVVRRGDQPPAHPGQGEPVKVRNHREAHEAGLEEGRTYYYGVFCAYTLDDHSLVWSRGLGEKVVPSLPPQPAQNFVVRVVGLEVHCAWTEPARGSVEVRRSAAPLGETGTRVLNSAELKTLLSRCDSTALQHRGPCAVDRAPSESVPYYTPIVRNGSLAIVGHSVECFVCAGVSDLEVFCADDTEIALRWRFPSGCKVVQVLARFDTWPGGSNDPEAAVETVTELEYESAGGLHRVPVRPGASKAFVAVLAVHRTPDGRRVFGSASDPASRCGPVKCLRPLSLAYGIRRALLARRKISLTLQVENPRTDFAGILLLASSSYPVTREAGHVVLQWRPCLEDRGVFRQSRRVSLAGLRAKGWRQCYLRMVTVEREQEMWTKIEHPALCAIRL